MPLFKFRIDLKNGRTRTGEREAESVEALQIELRKMPGYKGSGITSAERRVSHTPTPQNTNGLGWIDAMFTRL